jgi:hypothetical protein
MCAVEYAPMCRVPRLLPHFLAAIALLVSTGVAPQTVGGQTAAAGLKILVIAGEDAINVVQQKSAVAPVIEVRDRNDQPVAGAVVRFAIQSGRASFGGARTLTMTTNAAGRAVVTSLTPTGSGALQISATAAFQGQTAAVTIAQTNVMTAAQAATAAGAGGAGSGGGGAGAAAGGATGGGASGGLSATTVAIVGGAAAGGTLAARELGVLGGGSEYVGSFSGIIRYTPGGGGCFRDERHEGEIRLQIDVSDSGTVSGTAQVQATATVVTFTTGCSAPFQSQEYGTDGDATVTGTTAGLTLHQSRPGGPGVTFTFDLTGVLNGTEIAGTYSESIFQQPNNFGGSQNYPVTLTKQ